MNILSLYDGMACGMIAMKRGGYQVDSYDAYEIDKYAIQSATHNFPEIVEHGDVFNADFTEYKDIDFLMMGSPCTHWSIAQKNNRETEASGVGWELFSQCVKALREVKPKYFIYENNKSMSKAIRDSITETFGFDAICINSALVSAQNRQRLYWVGKINEDGTYSKVDVQQPEDRGILLRDILDNGMDLTSRDKNFAYTTRCNSAIPEDTISRNRHSMVAELVNQPIGETKGGKSYCLTAGYSNGSGENIGNYAAHTLEKGCKSMVAEPVACRCRGRKDKNGNGYAKYECRSDHKSNTLDTNATNGSMVAERVGDMPKPNGEISKSQGYRIYSLDAKSITVASNSGGIGSNTGLYAIPVNETLGNKAQRVRATCYKDGIRNMVGNDVDKRTCVAESVLDTPKQVGAMPRPNGELSTSQAFRVYDTNAKSVTLKAGGGGAGGKTGLYAIPIEFENGVPTKAISSSDGKTYKVYSVSNKTIRIKDKDYPIKLQDGYYIIRKLSVNECKRLQQVPDWYEFPVSDSQAYKQLGNGWSIEVILHLIKSCLGDE